jgi:hypothetical protein
MSAFRSVGLVAILAIDLTAVPGCGEEFAAAGAPSAPEAGSQAGTGGAAGGGGGAAGLSGQAGAAGGEAGAGMGGTSGEAGTSGASGASGGSGTSGSAGSSAGTGGAAANAGAGGASAGSAGVGGLGGSAGMGGIGGSAAGAAGSAGGPLEDCLNGKDDDGDGAVDCQDAGCTAGFECVPPIPSGWLGLFWVDPTKTQACTGSFTTQGSLYDPVGLPSPPPAQCSCACSAASGVHCQSSYSCGTTQAVCDAMSATNTVGDTCEGYTPPAGTPVYCKAFAPNPHGGSCQRSAVVLSKPPVSWPEAARSCRGTGGGACPGTPDTCMTRKPAGAWGPCVAQVGNIPGCPAPFTSRHLMHDGTLTDTRGCSDGGCGCGAPTSLSCACSVSGCSVRFYSTTNCGSMTSIGTTPTDGVCRAIAPSGGVTAWGMLVSGANGQGGSCPWYGQATSTGMVTPDPSKAVTVCCRP